MIFPKDFFLGDLTLFFYWNIRDILKQIFHNLVKLEMPFLLIWSWLEEPEFMFN